MKRTDITEIFPDATKEQLDKLMEINGADITAAKKGLDDVKTELSAANERLKDLDTLRERAGKVDDLQKELDGLKRTQQVKDIRAAVSKEKGVPASLLTAEDEDGCKKQADELLAWKGPASTPNYSIDQLLGGKAGKAGSSDTDAAFSQLRDDLFKG